MIQCENLMKIYKIDEEHEVIALQGLDLHVEKGEMMGIIGSSGSGKSTLLNMLGGLDRPTAGKLIVDGKNLLRLSDRELVKYKLESVGFVWQNNARNLIPYLSAVENVEMPMLLKGGQKRSRAKELLEIVGLGHRFKSKLGSLSGGEQQRVAIAIALANEPSLILADEPTGSVDGKTADTILDVLHHLNRELGVTVVIVTHDTQLKSKMDRIVAIRDGKTSSEILRRSQLLHQDQEDQEDTEEETHVELAVLDSARRIQIPEEYLKAIGITNSNKVHLKMEDEKIVIANPRN
ncbi:ABC transporter ATP-binding protein [Bacillus sp. J14TS2]|uniref:ABC transporter ATP-binding protein n=1 Tax=Bacillus sp. J14TS2 TaxID=2807188 RepID=UPI001B2ACEA2|nr:ABC transporter ATP-binding protein [Bacillus sp. J14TS2]GIN70629.1 ABC transporter ATP-binding protein [Bacillus sp. J14TS2]